MSARWRQVQRAGEVGLYPFTRAELGAVTLDAEAGPPVPMPAAEVSGAFAALTQLRVAVAQGQNVRLRTLVVATGGGRHWVLEGEWWQRAVPVTAGGLGGRVAALLKLPVS
jgi:hypothetical protein